MFHIACSIFHAFHIPYSVPRAVQDEALDSEGPRLAFEEMAKEVNQLAAAAAAKASAGAPPPAIKTADDVSACFGTPPSA